MNQLITNLSEDERIEIAKTTRALETMNMLTTDPSSAVKNALIDNPYVTCDVLFDIIYFNAGEVRDNAKTKLLEYISPQISLDNYRVLYFASKCFYWQYIQPSMLSGMTIPDFLTGKTVNRILSAICAFNTLYNENLYGATKYIKRAMNKNGKLHDFKIMSYYRIFPEELKKIQEKVQFSEEFIREVDDFARLIN